ncbi:hypothetical protein EJ04DRAFT_498250 [Polyplosphaeria fusca]|uniref:Uncharacterized protein n=1 Tax=Polyplosphaeria fusca TaxID=682080 RepID=A0A9P4V039_9PLEO|nr:hypothetical protein EJ04DRAFT_498250 [Polyplosphaeria fusca]
MCDTTFAFGQRGSHFLRCPSRKEYSRLPRKLDAIFSTHQIQQIYHVTLGFGESFLLTYRDGQGKDRTESQDLPSELDGFVHAKNQYGLPLRHVSNLRVTLGPYNSSFFAHDGSAYLWMNLPPSLLDALNVRIENGSWTDKPRIVALGCDNNFLLITEKHAAVCNLPHYRTLSNLIEFSKSQQWGIEEMHSAVLHGYRYQGFITQSRKGTLSFENLPADAMMAVASLRGSIVQDTAKAERMQLDVRSRSYRDNELRTAQRPSLLRHAMLRREWSETSQQITREHSARGMKLSLSVSISAVGIRFGKMI